MTSFKRWFGAGAIVLVALALIACPSMVPKVTNEIPDMQFSVADLAAGKAQTVTLADHFDVDRNPQYVAKSADPAVATATEANGILTVTPIASGTTNVTVTASKGGNDAISQAFSVTVAAPEPTPPKPPTPVNNPPVIRTYIDDMSLQVGMTKMLTLSEYYLDIDSLDVTYSAASSDESAAMISGPDANSVITITAVAEGSAQITVTAADPTLLALGLAVPQTFDVTVTATPPEPPERPERPEPPDNRSPVLLTSNLIVRVDAADFRVGMMRTYTLSDHFQDPDGDMLTYEATSDDSSVAAVTTPDVAGMFTLTAEGVGNTSITVKASDPYDASTQQRFTVGVGSNPPMLTNVSNAVALVLQDGMRTRTLDLPAYFQDPEDDDLTFAIADEGDSSIATVTGPDAMDAITITAVARGNTMIRVTAQDSDNDPVPLMFDVKVSDVPNKAPVVVSPIPDQSLGLDFDQMKMVNVTDNFSDPDGDPLTYTAESSMMEYVTASRDGSMITITAVAAGMATITVTASDGEASVDGTFEVTVTAPAVPTWKKEIPDVTFEHDGAPHTVMLADYFNRATMYDATSDDLTVVMADVNTEQTMLTLTRVGAGRAVVEITPSNSGGDGVVQSITVMVEAAPLGPALQMDKSFDDIKRVVIDAATTDAAELTKGTEDYDLTEYIHDPDGFGPDTLTFSTATSDPMTVAVYKTVDNTPPTDAELKQMKVGGKDVTVRARKGGSAEITVDATDISGAKMSWMFTVTVVADNNNEPTIESTFPGTNTGDDNSYRAFIGLDDAGRFKSTDTAPKKLKINLAMLFVDADVEERQRTTGDSWTFNAVSSNKAVVTAVLESTNNETYPDEYNVVITPVGSGLAMVHFTVTDSFGAMAGEATEHDFPVRVNSRPKAEGGQETPETLTKLSEKYKDLALSTGFGTVEGITTPHQVTLVEGNLGYFSDEEADDTLTCRFDTRGDGIFGDDFPKWDSAATRVQLNLATAETTPFEKKGTAYVDVWCTDGSGESSPKATLTIKVTSQGSIH